MSLHPDLQPRVAARLDFTGEGVDDGYGHGTHVAGMVAGNGRSSGGQHAGVAPGANIVSLKVLDQHGVGRTSDVIAAIEWVLQHGRLYGVRVINLSIGHPVVESYRSDPLNLAVQKAVRRGFVVVTSAGNSGRTDDGSVQYGSILSPANDPSVITVGAVDTNGTAFRSDDVVADFSSRGPTLFDGFVKPDVVAPGRRITSTAAPFSYLATTFPERLVAGATPEGGVSDAERHQHGRVHRQRHGGPDARGASVAAAGRRQDRAAVQRGVPRRLVRARRWRGIAQRGWRGRGGSAPAGVGRYRA